MAAYSGMYIPADLWRALQHQAFLTVPQAATFLSCDERTLRKAIASGEVPATRVGSNWRVPTAWLRPRVNPPDSDAA